MKKIILSLFFILSISELNAQQATSLVVHDTRNIDSLPSSYNSEVKAEFKGRGVVSVPGEGYFSAMLTLAPWQDYSGGKVTQLNFNEGGLFYRQGLQSNAYWESWSKLITEKNGITELGDIISGGTNSWMFHTPDDGRTSLYIAPLLSPGLYDWGHSIEFKKGNISLINGKLEAKEVKVTNSPTADFVFEEDYKLPSLEEIERHIKSKKHLPEIASAKEMEQEGVNIGEFQIKLLQKIEELTLYSIEQNKQIKVLLERLENLEKLKANNH